MTNTKPDVLNRAAGSTPEFNELMRDFRTHLIARNLSRGTVVLRVLQIEQLQRIHCDVLKVTGSDLERYLAARMRTHKPETMKSTRSSFRLFYSWAYETRRIPEDPAAALKPIRVPRTVARIADDDKLDQALMTADLPDVAAILLARNAGLRRSEIVNLHTADREGEVLRVKGKGSHTRMIPLDQDLADVLTSLENRQGSGHYFPGRFGGTMHVESLGKRITALTGMNPHSLRHRAATAMYDVDHDVRRVQEVLGHVSLATTERYVHVQQDHLVDLVQAAALPRRMSGVHPADVTPERVATREVGRRSWVSAVNIPNPLHALADLFEYYGEGHHLEGLSDEPDPHCWALTIRAEGDDEPIANLYASTDAEGSEALPEIDARLASASRTRAKGWEAGSDRGYIAWLADV